MAVISRTLVVIAILCTTQRSRICDAFQSLGNGVFDEWSDRR